MLRFLKPDTPAVCCPPGPLPVADQSSHVVVASLMRSGTHLAIDMLLDHFATYRQRPLYTNLDAFLRAGMSLEALSAAGGMVIKTHCPQADEGADRQAEARAFLWTQRVIVVHRNPEDVRKSLSRFGDLGLQAARFESVAEGFYQFWEGHPCAVKVSFEDITDPEVFPRVVHAVAAFLGEEVPERIIAPRPKSHRSRILVDKALTRLFGAGAPRINTGIGLSR